MVKGRNTKCITIRFEDSVIKILEARAATQGLGTAGAYIKQQVLKSIRGKDV